MGSEMCIRDRSNKVSDDLRKRKSTNYKYLVKCPFSIKYSLIGQTRESRRNKKNRLLFQVAITKAEHSHTCQPSIESQRIGMTRSG